VVDDVVEGGVAVGGRVGQVAVVGADFGHRAAVFEHDLKAVFMLPVALAFQRHVDVPVAVGVAADHRFIPELDVVEHVFGAVDLDEILVMAGGHDVCHDVVVVREDRCRGRSQRRRVEGQERADRGMEVFRGGVVLIAVDDDAAERAVEHRHGHRLAPVPAQLDVLGDLTEAGDLHPASVRRPVPMSVQPAPSGSFQPSEQ
jgi:hypothetical protein